VIGAAIGAGAMELPVAGTVAIGIAEYGVVEAGITASAGFDWQSHFPPMCLQPKPVEIRPNTVSRRAVRRMRTIQSQGWGRRL